jgi:hypothetical protein
MNYLKSYVELGYRDVDEAYYENRANRHNLHHFHYYDSGAVSYKKQYRHLYKLLSNETDRP